MKRSTLCAVTIAALFLAPTAGDASSPNKIAPDLGENDASSITVSMKCTVIGIGADRSVFLRDPESGAETQIAIAPYIRLRARSKKDFGGRRKLAFEDLGVGQTVRVTAFRHNGQITRIDVLERAR